MTSRETRTLKRERDSRREFGERGGQVERETGIMQREGGHERDQNMVHRERKRDTRTQRMRQIEREIEIE